MSATGFFNEIGIGLNEVPAAQVQSLGLNNVLQRPPFDSLPPPVKDFIDSLDGLAPDEQLNLIHQFTRDTIKYEPSANEQSDRAKNFSQTLASPKGDCDDIAVFESGIVQYAQERGVTHFDDVAVVGANIGYDYKDSKGNPQSAELDHNFVVVSNKGQNYYLDANAPHIGTADAKGGGFKSSLATSKGGEVDAHVYINSVDVVYDVSSGGVSAAPGAELKADMPAGGNAPASTTVPPKPAVPAM